MNHDCLLSKNENNFNYFYSVFFLFKAYFFIEMFNSFATRKNTENLTFINFLYLMQTMYPDSSLNRFFS